ncbi:hypothetical protein Trydic_g15494 [Trypoxylus dichotomus]
MTECIVDTSYGKLRGKLLTDIEGATFYGFQGIPYAKPPLGNLRFKAPQPPVKWTGIRDATSESSECYQRHMIFQTIIGSEDCLYLNVYTPQLPSDGELLRPVMVWIHGGAFTGGSSKADTYGPELLITEDVVIVTINYRLGVLGFLSLDDPKLDVSGNAGLKDMILALKWVQQNIKNFNGDPNNVTIFGESAGAVSVHLLMLSPLTEGLFHRAIAQSGCALARWAITESTTKQLCEVLNFITDKPREILQFLQKLPVEKLHQGQEMLQNTFGISRDRPIGPIIERPHEGAVLSENPWNLLVSGRYQKVPFLIGYNDREGMFFDMVENRMKKNMMITDFESIIPKCFKVEKGSEKSKEIAEKIKKFYYGDQKITVENKDIYYQLETDVVFLRDIYETVRLHTKTSDTPVYMYRFSVDAKLNFFKAVGKLTGAGAAHGDEMGYQFKTFLSPKEIDVKTIEGRTIYRMVKLWTKFAKSGDPNLHVVDAIIDNAWKPVTENQINFLDIRGSSSSDLANNDSESEIFERGSELVTGVNPNFERIKFWDELSKEYKIDNVS